MLFASLVSAQDDRITVFEGARKTQIPIKNIEGTAYIRITDLQKLFNFELNPIAGNQNLSVSIGQHNVILSSNRALVSLDDKLVSLSYPVYLAQGVWYVPLDFVSKVLKVTSEKRILWLEASRSLILGDIAPNQLILKYSVQTDRSRVVFQSVRPIGFLILYQNNALTVTPQSEDYLLGFQNTTFDDGVIGKLSIVPSGDKKIFRIETGAGYASFKSFDLSDPPRLVIDFFRKEAAASPQQPQEQPEPKLPETPSMIPSAAPAKRVIVIDPGHGGTENGAEGPEGTFEKDVVLSIARKLKGIIESNTGMRVILTRDGDEQVPLDDRASKANNNKANLFISIHANATIRGFAKGAETYFLSAKATDDEARNVAAVENNAVGLNQELPNLNNDLKLILWDMAQTEYLSESSQLAEMIQQELNGTLGIEDRGIKQAPFRVLMGAMMPAVLIEVGFINNPEEERRLKTADYQSKIAAAIFRSILKFQGTQVERTTQLQTGR